MNYHEMTRAEQKKYVAFIKAGIKAHYRNASDDIAHLRTLLSDTLILDFIDSMKKEYDDIS